MKKVLAVILSIILTMSCTSNVIASSTFNIATSPLLGDTSNSASVASNILPSGIIVLVDEDVEAYLNGTLVFYDKDDLPVTQ